jgi:hypothetical protein
MYKKTKYEEKEIIIKERDSIFDLNGEFSNVSFTE